MDSVSDSTGWECARSSTNGRQADIRNSFAIKLRRYFGVGALPLRRAASDEIEERREDGTDDHILRKANSESVLKDFLAQQTQSPHRVAASIFDASISIFDDRGNASNFALASWGSVQFRNVRGDFAPAKNSYRRFASPIDEPSGKNKNGSDAHRLLRHFREPIGQPHRILLRLG